MKTSAVHDLLVAEAQAFPFTSRAAFDRCTRELAIDDAGQATTGTASLRRALEDKLRPLAQGMSIEDVHRVIDLAWFHDELLDGSEPGPPASRDLADYLAALGGRYLKPGGDRVLLADDGDYALRMRRYRWLSLMVPADLLIAGCAAYRDEKPGSDRVSLITPQLGEILQRGVADTHLHRGAALSFALLWTGLMGGIAKEPPRWQDLDAQGPPPFGGGETFLAMLVSAAIARVLFATFLWHGPPPSMPFSSFFRDRLGPIVRAMAWPSGDADALACLNAALATLRTGARQPGVRTPELRKILDGLTSVPRSSFDSRASDVDPIEAIIRSDPLVAWFDHEADGPAPETRFTTLVLGYLRTPEGRADEELASLFWQYQRVRGMTYRHLTQEPGVSGLDWFGRHFQRLWPLRSARISEGITTSALAHQAPDVRLSSLETRTSPDSRWFGLWQDVKRVATQTRDHNERASRPDNPVRGGGPTEIGLVLHFLKESGHGSPEEGCRFRGWRLKQDNFARAVETLLGHKPEALLVLRGIDMANTELSVPLWPAVPIFDRLRRASVAAADALRAMYPGWRVPPFRATFHAGEDFRRLSDGLRRMHELIEFDVLVVGDRIGHGLALGTDPDRWARTATTRVQPVEERLDDLLWELARVGAGDLPTDAGRLEAIRQEAARWTSFLYGDSSDPLIAARARTLRHQLHRAPLFHVYPQIAGPVPTGLSDADNMVYRYLTDEAVYERGRRPIEVRASDAEVRMLKDAQRWLRRELSRREITLETNPSSNLLIANYADIEDHPAFRLQPLPGHPTPDGGNVLVTINVDDPITFASRLADEFAYFYAALLRSDVTSQDALEWLDRVRDNAVRARFTVPASADAGVLSKLERRDDDPA